MSDLLALLILAAAPVAGALLGRTTRIGWTGGFIAGLFLSWVGVLIVVMMTLEKPKA